MSFPTTGVVVISYDNIIVSTGTHLDSIRIKDYSAATFYNNIIGIEHLPSSAIVTIITINGILSPSELTEAIGIADSFVYVPTPIGQQAMVPLALTKVEMEAYTATDGELVIVKGSSTIVYWDSATSLWYRFDGSVFNLFIVGTGPAGIYNEQWDTNSEIQTYWSSNRTISTTTNATTAGNWNQRSGTTPSSSTGTLSAVNGSYFLYTEVSSSAHANTYELETSNFMLLTQIEFNYNLIGSNAGRFSLEYFDDDIWHEIFSVSGAQGAQWNYIILYVSTYDISKIRFTYEDATSWQGDLCIDNVILTSV